MHPCVWGCGGVQRSCILVCGGVGVCKGHASLCVGVWGCAKVMHPCVWGCGGVQRSCILVCGCVGVCKVLVSTGTAKGADSDMKMR